jgi:pSer/pThr/pTyr-binding forkhead associated (FHA) protein
LKHICQICEFENRMENRYCTQCGSKLVSESQKGPHLILLNGNKQTNTFTLIGDHINLGRSLDNTIILKDDQVSKHHARLYYSDQKYWIKDLGSRNGVYVNGKRVVKPKWLLPGSLIKVGATILRFEENI